VLVTGESKGYGLIRYASQDCAAAARTFLNGRRLTDRSGRSSTLECDWLASSRLTLASLHAKALYVENFPAGYRDMAEFRKTFAVVTKPAFCSVSSTT